MRSDAIGPGQAFTLAAMEVCREITGRGNEVTIRWVPVHSGIEGNEVADRWAKVAADRAAPCSDSDTPESLLTEASLPYMTRTATEARSRAAAEWISDKVCAERQYRPPPGRGLRRQQLRGTRKEFAGRSTSSYRAMRTSAPTFTGWNWSMTTRAGGVTPASVRPDSISSPAAQRGGGRHEYSGSGSRSCVSGTGPGLRRSDCFLTMCRPPRRFCPS